MPQRNIEGQYPYAYQGQEKDAETGMEAFELRLWDARIGRWLSPDPYGQYHSPYMGMDNRPMSSIDPDGGCTTEGGRPCQFSVLGGTATDFAGNTWSSAPGGDITLLGQSIGEVIVTASGPSLASKIWNHASTRGITGDAISFGGGYAANIFVGLDISAEFTWVIRGKDASIIPNFTMGPAATVGDGGEITASVFVSKKIYFGSVDQINARDLGGYSAFAEAGLTPGIGGFGGSDISFDNYGTPIWISAYGGVSAGAEASPLTVVNIKGGVRHNTILMHSNGNLYINNPVEPDKNLIIDSNFKTSYE